MKTLFALIFLLTSLFSEARDIKDFINITKPGIYDFKGEVIHVQDGAMTPAIVIGDAKNEIPSFEIKNVVLKNLTIFGNKDHQDSEFHSVYPYLRNNGITIRRGCKISIENVMVIGARSGGLVTEKNSSNITVRGSYFISNYFDGVACCETKNSLFENITVTENKYAGISLDWNNENLTFRKIYSYRNRDWTVYQRASRNITFENLVSKGNGGSLYVFSNPVVGQQIISSAFLKKATLKDTRGNVIEGCCRLFTKTQE